MAFKFPLDAYVLMVPIAYASVAMMTLVARVPLADPETSTSTFYDDEQKSSQVAQRYNSQFKQFFDARIRNHKVGVFSNWVSGSPQ